MAKKIGSMSRGRWLLVATVAAVGFGGYFLWPRQTLKGAGEDLIESVVKGNAESVLRFSSATEIELSGLTKENLREFLEKIVLPRIGTFHRVNEAKEVKDSYDWHLVLQQTLENPEGNRVYLAFNMQKTPDGPRCDEVCYSLVTAVCYAIEPKMLSLHGEGLARRSLEVWDRLMPELNGLGLKGVALALDVGHPMTFLTWQEIREYKAARLRAKVGP